MKKLILAVVMLCVVTSLYSQQSVRCIGIKSSGERCKMSTDSPDSLCHFHNTKHQCGVLKANGETCKISVKNAKCKYHDPSMRCGAQKASGGTCGNPKATCQYHGE